MQQQAGKAGQNMQDMTQFRTETVTVGDGQRRVLWAAVVVSFLLTIWNHLLPPFDYALTHFFFDYSEGFLRRGLTGAVLERIWPAEVTVSTMYLTAFCITFPGALAVAIYLARWLRGSVAALLLLIIALNSYAFTSFVGFVGYLDGLLAICAMAALAVPATGGPGMVLRIALLGLGALIHESMIPYFACLVAFDVWMAHEGTRRWMALWPLAASAVLAVALLRWGALPPEGVAAMAERMAERMPIPPHADAIAILGQSLSGHEEGLETFRQTQFYQLSTLCDGATLAAMSLWLLWLAFRVMGGNVDGWTKLGATAAVLGPLSINLIAYDIARFGAVSVISGFCVIAILLRRQEGAGERLTQNLGLGHALLVLVLNVNLFTMMVAQGTGHTGQAPWVTFKQLAWFEGEYAPWKLGTQ